jgi:hypothetical protein
MMMELDVGKKREMMGIQHHLLVVGQSEQVIMEPLLVVVITHGQVVSMLMVE